jgi:two-component system OmpR family response regulator
LPPGLGNILCSLAGIVTADSVQYDKYVSITMNIDNGKITTKSTEIHYGSAPNLLPAQGGFKGELVAADGSIVKTFTVWDPRIQFGDVITENSGGRQIQGIVDRRNSADFVVVVPFERDVNEFRLYHPEEGTLLASVNLKPQIDSFFASYPDDPENPALSGSKSPVMARTSGTGIPGPDAASSGQLPGLTAIGSGTLLLLGGGFASVRFLRKKPRRILIVDDDRDVIEVIEGMLRLGGYDTRSATGGEDCLKALEAEIPDLILLDIGMERMDGWETLRRIKKNPVTKNIPVIMLTARKLVPKDVEDYGIFIEDYIMKPVTSRGLADAIAYSFARQQVIEKKIAAVKAAGLSRNELCECARLTRVVDVNKRLWDLLVKTYTQGDGMADPGGEMTLALKNTERKIREQERRLEQIRLNHGSGTRG